MTKRLPEFITFTGADDHTELAGMVHLSCRWPIEWGILLSPTRQGSGRYPNGATMSRLWWSGLRLSAHLCGQHSRDIMEGDVPRLPVDLFYCGRVQVNHAAPTADTICRFAKGWGDRLRGIAQTRDMTAFPTATQIDWLFDQSGGRGEAPPAWPRHPGGDRLVGYAGGINPGNVLDVLSAIDAEGPYWIDMESGVRDGADRFDLSLCRQVCELVYGQPRGCP